MKLQVLSDLHLETEAFHPEPAPDADVLVLAGDVDSRWEGLARFADWPVPVVFVPGNHEFDQRELLTARPALRERCLALGLHLLDCDTLVLSDAAGQRVRFVGCTRWCDFDTFGADQRERALRAAGYFVKVMRATRKGAALDAAAVREEAVRAREWLQAQLVQPRAGWDRCVVITHYAPSLLSADPRYGRQLSTASFCNADDALVPLADLWIHGHLHCRNAYEIGGTPVVCNARGHGHKNEPEGFDPLRVVSV